MVTFVNIKTTGDSNYVGLAVQIASTVQSISGPTATSFTVKAANGRSATITGTGFVYNDDGVPVAGDVTGIVSKINNKPIAVITGLDIDVAAVASAFLSGTGDLDDLIALFGDMRVRGNIGNDTLGAGAGDDIFFGGKGADQMFGTAGNDTVDYSSSTAGVVANLSNPAGNTGDAAGDIYGSIENLTGSRFADRLTGNSSVNTLTGGNGADTLAGGVNRDTLIGGNGSDKLIGGRGIDTLIGGGGGDTFIYNRLNEGRDKVTFFDANDKVQIDLSNFGLDPGDLVGQISGTNPQAVNGSPTLLYDTDDKMLIWDANGSGAGGRTLLLTITGPGAINLNDDILFV